MHGSAGSFIRTPNTQKLDLLSVHWSSSQRSCQLIQVCSALLCVQRE